MSIHLPSTALETLGVSLSKRTVFAPTGDQISLVLSGVSYIVLILQQQNVTLYFKWGSPSSNIHQVAFAEYSKRLATDSMVSISCPMVEYIKFVDVMSGKSASIDVQQYLPAPDAPATSIECVSQ